VIDTPRARFETTGNIDVISNERGALQIDGWVAALDGGPIHGFELSWNRQTVEGLQIDGGLPSPDVAAAKPELARAEACRFHLHGPAQTTSRDLLVRVTPIRSGQRGHALYRLVDPELPVPPDEHVHAIGGGFEGVALEMLGHFVDRAGLGPDERVLDVGCGVGRIAYALAYYLTDRGQYDGFDIMRPLTDWASQHLGSRLSRFTFRHVDVYNRLYNPEGRLRSDTFDFPYGAASFDLVCLTSVFTHMHGPEIRHYLDEIARVLAPGGRVVLTAFLLTPDAKRRIRERAATQLLVHRFQDGFVVDRQSPEYAVGYDEDVLTGWIAERGLYVSAFYPGSWSGRSSGASYQDLLILERSGVSPGEPRKSGFLSRWFAD
jgi:SAM-dependent methyltransferase